MRASLALWLAIVSSAFASPALAQSSPDDDDPKNAAANPAVARAAPGPEHDNPVVKLSYRRFNILNLDNSGLAFNAGQLDLYPVSMRYLRVGVQAEIGGGGGTLYAGTSNAKPTSAWYVATGFSLGFQYPMRVTPFVDWRFAAGLIGGDVEGSSGVSWIWMTGIEGGIELYVFGRMYLTAAVGWVHPSYRGIDYAYSQAHPNNDPPGVIFTNDTWTVKVGFGF